MTAHAKYRPPSGASRWLSCPASASLIHLYDVYGEVPKEAADRGTLAHHYLELYLLFGIKPDTDDPDMDLNVLEAGDWIKARKAELGNDCQMYVEEKLPTPYTGEFGTPDVVFVTPKFIEIVDYKNGYVPVDIYMNAQLMVYLISAIAKYGTRKKYKITLIQPNYNHADGPIRSFEPDHEQVEWFENEVRQAVAYEDNFAAGKHCKTTYCEHRGNCATFMAWAKNNAGNAWWPYEVNGISDDELADALDHAEILQGLRDEFRKQALIRIKQHNRTIRGYKVVKSRSQRDFAGDEGRSAAYMALLDMGYTIEDLVERKPIQIGSSVVYEQSPLTVAGVERMVKQKFKHFGRGKWKEVFDEHIKPHIREFSGSITLERAIDGRPAITQGSEFTPITNKISVPSETSVTII